MRAARAIARQTLRDARTRTAAFAYLFAAVSFVQPYAYRHSYSTVAERMAFARSFADNKAVRLLYGEPFDLLSAGGYAAWRVGGSLAIFAAIFGLLAATRALRGEEESGRLELVLSGIVGRRGAYLAAVAGVVATAAVLWLASFAGLVLARLNAGDAAYLALAILSVGAVFVGVGTLTSQVAATRRQATGLATAALAVWFVLRVVADTSPGAAWLRWTTPFGWAEEMRAFTGARPAVVLLPIAATGLLLAAAGVIAVRRDVGAGLLPAHDTAPPRLRLLSSPLAQAFRDERWALLAWALGTGALSLILGIVSDSVDSAGISDSLRERFQKLGTTITTSSGYLGFAFLFVILVVSLYGCSQIAAARAEESEQRLETLLALPVSRRRWLVGRLVLAAAGAAAVAMTAAFLAWVGAASQDAGISLSSMLEAGANCLPVALLFLGLGALAFAVLPRAAAGIAYGLVGASFVWETIGALLDVPPWLLDLSPFHHVGLVPAESFHAVAAVVMVALAGLAAAVATWGFDRRDLAGA
jgi:polyether ionophore transport system permease protein